MIHMYRLCAGLVLRSTNAVSANSPPSPRLSARMMTRTYLTMTISTKAHTISESAPRMACSLMSPKSISDCRTA